jgi:hypothetical protein
MYKFLLILIFSSSSSSSLVLAAEAYSSILNLGFGMAAISATENDTGLVQTDSSVASTSTGDQYAASTSVIALDATYEFSHNGKYSYLVRGLVPLLTSNGASIFLGSFGFNWYLNDLGTKYSVNIDSSSITMVPTLSYYIGGAGGVGYHVYNTESAQFSDTYFDLSFHGGVNYKLKKNFGLSGKGTASRVTGVATTGISYSVSMGLFYYL